LGPPGLHKDVGSFEQIEKSLTIIIVVQIKLDALFAASEHRPAGFLAESAPARGLHHDDLCAAVGEKLRRHRGRQSGIDLHRSNALQRRGDPVGLSGRLSGQNTSS
jgi:hypothetical protein